MQRPTFIQTVSGWMGLVVPVERSRERWGWGGTGDGGEEDGD